MEADEKNPGETTHQASSTVNSDAETPQLPPTAASNTPVESSPLSDSAGGSVKSAKTHKHLADDPGAVKANPRKGFRFTPQRVEEIYRDWLENPDLSHTKRAKKFGTSTTSISTLINIGNQTCKCAPFAARKHAEDVLNNKVTDFVVNRVAVLSVERWEKSVAENLQVIQAAKHVTAQLLKFVGSNLANIRLTSRTKKETHVVDGVAKQVEVPVPMTVAEAASTTRALTQIAEAVVRTESLLFGAPTARLDVTQDQQGILSLSAEQVHEIVLTGVLPPGVDEASFFSKHIAELTGVAK